MKILWVTNMPVGDLALALGLKATSGQWLNAELETERALGQNEIVVCTSGAQATELSKDNIKYVVLPHGAVSHYAVTPERIEDWRALLQREAPDVLFVWGTEYDIGRCALLANQKNIPSLIYIQGVMSSIAEHYRGGLTDGQISAFTTLFERLRKRTVWDMERLQQRRTETEKECVMLSDGVVLETEWAERYYKSISPELRVFKSRLPIKQEFAGYLWQEDSFEPHSIVTTAANYPLKGLHRLLEALHSLKRDYPDVKLYVPGPNNVTVKGFKARLVQSGYCKSIAKRIKQYGLSDAVVFTGPLTTPQYAERMQRSCVFVSASAIENHCSALREAMSVGVPCVASRVGGIPEYATDGVNCSLYDFADSEALARAIAALFEDGARRQAYSAAGRATIKRMYREDTMSSLHDIYGDLCATRD